MKSCNILLCNLSIVGSCIYVHEYHQISNISCTESQYLNVSRLTLQLTLCNLLKPGVQNEYVVGAVLTSAAPTTFQWSTVLLPTNLQLILEI